MNKFILVVILALSGCTVATHPPLSADFKLNENARIGYISAISKHPVYKHIGLTVFGNFEKDSEESWNLNEYIFSVLSDALKQKGNYSLIDISNKKESIELLSSEKITMDNGSNMILNTDEFSKYRKTLADNNLDALIVISSRKIFYLKDFDRVVESKGDSGDHGIHTAKPYVEGSVFDSALGSRVYSLSPKPQYLGWSSFRLVDIKLDPQPKVKEKITHEEFSAYETQVKNIIKKEAINTINLLPIK